MVPCYTGDLKRDLGLENYLCDKYKISVTRAECQGVMSMPNPPLNPLNPNYGFELRGGCVKFSSGL